MSKVTLIIGPTASGKTTLLNKMIEERKDKGYIVCTIQEIEKVFRRDRSTLSFIAVDGIEQHNELMYLLRIGNALGVEIIATSYGVIPKPKAYRLIENLELINLHRKGGVKE